MLDGITTVTPIGNIKNVGLSSLLNTPPGTNMKKLTKTSAVKMAKS